MHGGAWEWHGRTLLLALKILPRGVRNEWLPMRDGRLAVRLQAPPVDGKANRELIEFLAAQFGVAKRQVQIVSGAGARLKRVAVEAPQCLPATLAVRAPQD